MSEFDAGKLELIQNFEGVTTKELAARSGLPERRISDMRRGLTEFRESDVEAICYATGFPKTFFLLKESTLSASSLTFRRPSRMRTGDVKRVASEFSMLSDSAKRLLEMCKMSQKADWIDEIAPNGTPDGDDIERIAVETRAQMSIPDTGPVRNVMWAFEGCGIVIAPLKTSCTEMEVSAEGVSCPLDSSIPVIAYLKNRRSGDGIRFTVSHEAGHLILQRKRIPSTKKMMEEEAHRFAGAFLFPIKDAKAVLAPNMNLKDYAEVKAGWGISISALITRAARLGVIDRDRQRSLMIQMSARHWNKNEPVEVKQENPIFFKQMIGSNFGHIISPTEVSVSSLAVSQFLGRPFPLINIWADGLKQKDDDESIPMWE